MGMDLMVTVLIVEGGITEGLTLEAEDIVVGMGMVIT